MASLTEPRRALLSLSEPDPAGPLSLGPLSLKWENPLRVLSGLVLWLQHVGFKELTLVHDGEPLKLIIIGDVEIVAVVQVGVVLVL